MNRFELVMPRTAEEAVTALGKGGTAKAAGIDLLDRMKDGISTPSRLVSLFKIGPTGSAAIEVGKDGARIGALATLAEIASHAELRKRYPALTRSAEEAATPQVRNRATAGGNVLQEPRCWYYRLSDFTCLRKGGKSCPALEGDNRYHAVIGFEKCPVVAASSIAPALVALGATVETTGSKSPRPVEDLYAAPGDLTRFYRLSKGEIVTAIVLPGAGANAYSEVRHKQSFDWALASAAVAHLPKSGWRVVLGAVAPAPWRDPAAEKVLGTGDPGPEKIAEARRASLTEASPLPHNAYKIELARVALARALEQAVGGRK